MDVLLGLGTDPLVVAVCGAVVVLGALVQGVLGFGLAMVSVPVLAWLAPSLVPVGVLVAILPLVVVQAVRERAHVDLPGLGWALLGRLPGGVAGAVAVAVLPVRGLQVLVAATVLLAVAASATADVRTARAARAARPDDPAPVVRRHRSVLVLAGVLSGLGGTTSGIGGPPMALVFRNSGGPVIRSTLATFFVLGAGLSFGSLAAVGELTGAQLLAGLVLLPFVAVGYLAAGALRGRVDARAVRSGVLVMSAVAGVGLLVGALAA